MLSAFSSSSLSQAPLLLLCPQYFHSAMDSIRENQLNYKMECLPHDIILNILSRLPITSILRFKYVCRAWRQLAQDSNLANVHLSCSSKKDPCLIFHSDTPIQNQLHFVDISAHNSFEEERVKRIKASFWNAMPEFDVVGSCNGLVCLSDSLYNDAIYVCNPFTRQYMELPKSTQYPDQYLDHGFGFHPKTREYKVLKMVYFSKNAYNSFLRVRRNSYTQSEMQIFTLGSSKWKSLGEVPYHLERQSPVTFINGRLHWVTCYRWQEHPLGCTRSIVSFDLDEERFQEVPKPDCGGMNNSHWQLMILRGCLSVAFHHYEGTIEIWVMKEYGVKESWIKEVQIGTYLPTGMNETMNRPLRIFKNARNERFVRVVCRLNNGEILLEYKCRVLVTYDPTRETFKELKFQGMPKWFQTFVHVGSLCWIDSP